MHPLIRTVPSVAILFLPNVQYNTSYKHTPPPPPTHTHTHTRTEHAESLPHEERKVYAERVAMAFWDAIGGDKEELATD